MRFQYEQTGTTNRLSLLITYLFWMIFGSQQPVTLYSLHNEVKCLYLSAHNVEIYCSCLLITPQKGLTPTHFRPTFVEMKLPRKQKELPWL